MAPLAEMILFIRSLTVKWLALGVLASPGYCTLLPPTSNLVLFGSSIFSGWIRHVMMPWVTSFVLSHGPGAWDEEYFVGASVSSRHSFTKSTNLISYECCIHLPLVAGFGL